MTEPLPALRAFDGVRDWIFDLDNTLYPRACNLWAQIDVRITAYMMDVTGLAHAEARALQKTYYRDFGTSLNGLMQRHGVDPDHFLGTVHAIDYSPVPADPGLVEAIAALPGRRFILTNGDVPHANQVLGRLGAAHLFEGVFDIKAMGYRPKPQREAYEAFLGAHGIDPRRAAMFDDLEKNLLFPHENGMRTVQVVAGPGYAHAQIEPWELDRTGAPHVHHITDDLAGFLRALP